MSDDEFTEQGQGVGSMHDRRSYEAGERAAMEKIQGRESYDLGFDNGQRAATERHIEIIEARRIKLDAERGFESGFDHYASAVLAEVVAAIREGELEATDA